MIFRTVFSQQEAVNLYKNEANSIIGIFLIFPPPHFPALGCVIQHFKIEKIMNKIGKKFGGNQFLIFLTPHPIYSLQNKYLVLVASIW